MNLQSLPIVLHHGVIPVPIASLNVQNPLKCSMSIKGRIGFSAIPYCFKETPRWSSEYFNLKMATC